jgi:AraC-like DNA-binding protein
MADIKKINLEMFTPTSPELREYVQAIWFAHTDSELEDDLDFKVLTDCASGLVLNYGDLVKHTQRDCESILKKSSLILGPSKNLLTMTFSKKVDVIGIRFYPESGHLFFKSNMEELSNSLIEADNENIDSITNLYKDLSYLKDKEIIISRIEEYLKQLIKERDTSNFKQLRIIIDHIRLNPQAQLADISTDLSISVREIQRLFKEYVGVLPKNISQMLKITDAKNIISDDQNTTLTEVSSEVGYFDQSHFNKDFKVFMEETPGKYKKIKRGIKK